MGILTLSMKISCFLISLSRQIFLLNRSIQSCSDFLVWMKMGFAPLLWILWEEIRHKLHEALWVRQLSPVKQLSSQGAGAVHSKIHWHLSLYPDLSYFLPVFRLMHLPNMMQEQLYWPHFNGMTHTLAPERLRFALAGILDFWWPCSSNKLDISDQCLIVDQASKRDAKMCINKIVWNSVWHKVNI